ncbi:carbohydrate ABC transporter permease [Nonomuraea endophytica]|uniref:Multiple sugar transport system permease protein n=1 Tax=Nonomuraea endophytica TaxID=714136 RepID=A0A7W8AFI0_9ACTN|nr:carbohydrate ABC transporter permease [Nonomuraea endophytica]MBB5084155.1 multiple sugar transport system permease protein [Nonomuraea endophytica]
MIGRVIRYGTAALFTVAALFPLAWMAVAGFKAKTEVVATPFQFFPEMWRWENYALLLGDAAFLRSLAVTFTGAVLFAMLSLAVNALGAYAFARLDFALKRTLWFVVITTMFVPGIAIMLTSFVVVTQLGMLDSLAVLVIPGAASGLQVFFLRQYYLGLPVALEEAAQLDGAGPWRVFLHIFVPLSKGAFVVVGVTSFLAFWNAYIWPVLTITDPELFQVQQYLATFRSDRSSEMGLLMAGSTLAALPVIVLFLCFQRHIIAGIRISGLK